MINHSSTWLIFTFIGYINKMQPIAREHGGQEWYKSFLIILTESMLGWDVRSS